MSIDELFGREPATREKAANEDDILQGDVIADEAEEYEYCEAEEVTAEEAHTSSSDNDKITIDLSFLKNIGKEIADGLKGLKSDVKTSVKNAGFNWSSSSSENGSVDRVLENFNSIYARLCNACNAKIIEADRFEIKAWGTEKFIQSLSFDVANGKLSVIMQSYNANNESDNNIEIYVDFDKGEMLDVTTSGAVDLEIEPDFEVASFNTSGACDVSAGNFDQIVAKLSGACDFEMEHALDAEFIGLGACDIGIGDVSDSFRAVISGAGDIGSGHLHNAYIQISGSGNADVDEASGDLTVKLSGSSDVAVGGNVDNLILSLSGSCSFDGSDLTANEADITASGPCDIEIDRVYGPIKQSIDRLSDVKINNRGDL
ncbi:MAG: DUF2807 domain-containing protein [Oscillospiraceae bacterium]|nr:DUF2807 domain-containing protein [Oscillospiraceae bacterium]